MKPDEAATITIVYDSNRYDGRLTPAWGFSCVVRVADRTILFDTGGDGDILLDNMTRLAISPAQIDTIVLSHIHGDHTGGLKRFLANHSEVTIYLTQSFPIQVRRDIGSYGAKVESVHGPEELSEGVFTTGELDAGIEEQSLLVRSSEMLVTVTGCAHPGIVNITRKAGELTGNTAYLAVGGFHLGGASGSQISQVAGSLLQLGVRTVAPCHCTGDEARRIFKDCFGSESYIDAGVGSRIIIE